MHFLCIVMLCQSASSDILKCPFPLRWYTEKNTSVQPFNFVKNAQVKGLKKNLYYIIPSKSRLPEVQAQF